MYENCKRRKTTIVPFFSFEQMNFSDDDFWKVKMTVNIFFNTWKACFRLMQAYNLGFIAAARHIYTYGLFVPRMTLRLSLRDWIKDKRLKHYDKWIICRTFKRTFIETRWWTNLPIKQMISRCTLNYDRKKTTELPT